VKLSPPPTEAGEYTSSMSMKRMARDWQKERFFSAIDYDPEDKGDLFILSYGNQAPLTTHVVDMPLELWQAQNEVGKVILLQIIDAEEKKLMIEFV
jgi:hypothetical protein